MFLLCLVEITLHKSTEDGSEGGAPSVVGAEPLMGFRANPLPPKAEYFCISHIQFRLQFRS